MKHPLTDEKLNRLFWNHAVNTGWDEYDWTSDGMRAAYDLGWENAKKQDWTHSPTDEIPEIKACFDCKYCCSQEDAKENYGGWFVCLHPSLGKPDFLTGTLKLHPTIAVEHRKTGKCGFDAKYWKAK